MAERTQRNHGPAFNAKAMEGLQRQESVAAIARRYKLHGNLEANWKKQLAENVARVFETEADHDATKREDELLKRIGERRNRLCCVP